MSKPNGPRTLPDARIGVFRHPNQPSDPEYTAESYHQPQVRGPAVPLIEPSREPQIDYREVRDLDTGTEFSSRLSCPGRQGGKSRARLRNLA